MLSKLLDSWLRPQNRNRRRKKSLVEMLEDRTLLATLSVTQPLDIVAPDGLLSLREAITAVNSLPTGPHEIIIPANPAERLN